MKRSALKLWILLAGLVLCTTLLAAQTEWNSTAATPASLGGFGIGIGLPYGGLGFCGELNLGQHAALTAGLGTMLVKTGYNAGVKVTLLSPQQTLRPNLTMLYGVNGLIIARDEGLPQLTEALHGFSGGVGAQLMFGDKRNHGLELRLMYIIGTGLIDRIEELEAQGYGPFTRGSKFAYAVGYRYAF